MSEQTPYQCFGCKATGKVGSEWHRPGCRAPKWEPVVVLPAERAAALLRLEAAVGDDDMAERVAGPYVTGKYGENNAADAAIAAYRAALLARMEGGTERERKGRRRGR